MKKIKRLFYISFLGNIYFSFLLWLDRRKEKKERKLPNFTTKQIVRQTSQMYYEQGMHQLKTKINSLVKTTSTEEYVKALDETQELIKLAELEPEDRNELSELLYKIAVKKGKDLNTDMDFAKMIDKRINDYRELQRYKVERELLRKIRDAKVSGSLDIAKTLEEEWRSKYGRFKRN